MSMSSRRRRPHALITMAAAAAMVATLLGASPTSATSEAAATPTAAEQPTTVFTRSEAGYHTFRIPALVEAPDGTLLAFAQGRVNGSSDWGDADLVLKRSTDGGATWGPLQVIADDDGNWRIPTPIVDQGTGRIVLVSSRVGGSLDGSDDIDCARADPEDLPHSYVRYSDDDGATWSEPVDITDQVSRPNWNSFFGGPGHGIQLTHGEHAGRIVIAGRHTLKPEPGSGEECSGPTDQGNHAVYSDDGGISWQIGAVDEQGDPDVRPNEPMVVELDDGRLYFNSRDQGFSPGRRLDTTSNDGGESFAEPYDAMHGVITSRIDGSLAHLPAIGDRPDRLVFSITNHPTSRESLTLYSSFDDGATWEPSYEVWDGPAGYSDTAVLDDREGNREIGVLFESGKRFYADDPSVPNHHDISFTRVPERLLDTPAPPPRTTPDATGDHDGVVGGSPDLVPGRFGNAMEFAGDTVDLPLTQETAFGSGPFTAAAWFRTEDRRSQSLVYSHGRFGPHWWIMVEPDRDRIRAQVHNGTSVRNLDIRGDYADNQWHHVALTRGSDGLTLYLDGAAIDTATRLGGSVSADARFGTRIGARLDVLGNVMVGAVDEVWMFDRVLTAEQVADLAANNAVDGVQSVAHLPLDRITRACARP